MKVILVERFTDNCAKEVALYSLRDVSQKQGESAQAFGDRLLTYAEGAYSSDELSDILVQSKLVDVFIDGVIDDLVARKLIRNRPDSHNAAIRVATIEQQVHRTFEIRRQKEEKPIRIEAIKISTEKYKMLTNNIIRCQV